MEENQKKCYEIAERIYDLDVKVEALGRRYLELKLDVADENTPDVVIQKTVEQFGKVDILNKKRAKLNTARTKKKFKKGDHLVICIGRTQGSAGNDIGFALADALHINYYDVEILQEVLKRLDVTNDAKVSGDKDQDGLIEDKYQKNFGEAKGLKQKLHDFNRYHGLNKDDAIFFNQSDLLCKMAKEEDFVVMGRCADVILANNHIPHISIFITAPFEQRVKRYMEINNLSLKQAVHELKKMDKKHRKYFQFYSGVKWGDAENYDICFNSASYGIEDSVEIIERMLNKIPGVSWNKKEA